MSYFEIWIGLNIGNLIWHGFIAKKPDWENALEISYHQGAALLCAWFVSLA